MRGILTCLTALLPVLPAQAGEAAKPAPPIRFMLHGNMSHELPTEEYLRFVERIRPDMLIMGVFDQRLYALGSPDPSQKKKEGPLSPREHLARWQAVIERLHKKGIRLVGQMELFVVSDRPSERDLGIGWFGFHDRMWDERFLGRRPARTAAELLEMPDLDRHAALQPLKHQPEGGVVARCGCQVNARALRGCASNPFWRATQKAMVKAALDIGVDGFITNRNYFEHCACNHCAAEFRRWLGERHGPEQLLARFGIRDVGKETLCVVGPFREHDNTPAPLLLEKMRFARHAVKRFFDDVYVEHGRKLKPDVLLAQWNHMAYFDELHLDKGHLPPATRTNLAHAVADERWSLPADLWGKGESFFWYCNWGTTQNTILEKEYAGDTVLYGKYLRAMARGRPYVINKYDFYRPRVMMAEAAALGYTTNAIATPWQTEPDREVVTRYFDFLRRHADLYRSADTFADVALIFPRRALEAGDASPLEYTEAAGRTMIRQHILFDIIPDNLMTAGKLLDYAAVVIAAPEYLSQGDRNTLFRYVKNGGKIVWTPVAAADRDRAGAATPEARLLAKKADRLFGSLEIVAGARLDRSALVKTLHNVLGDERSRFDCPWTVQVHAYQEPERLVVHLVNYNHKEKASGKSLVEREAPIRAEPVGMQIPVGMRVKSVTFLSPDEDRPTPVEFRQAGRKLELRTPSFLVYGVLVIEGGR